MFNLVISVCHLPKNFDANRKCLNNKVKGYEFVASWQENGFGLLQVVINLKH